MQAQATIQFYKSGFPKEVQRGKYNFKINERLKSARKRKGLSCAKVVAELKKRGTNIGHSTLQGYEACETSLNHRYPSLPVLIGLSRFYGCSLDYLFGLTNKFKIQHVQNSDIRDLLDSEMTLTYNGNKLNQEQRDALLAHFDLVLDN